MRKHEKPRYYVRFDKWNTCGARDEGEGMRRPLPLVFIVDMALCISSMDYKDSIILRQIWMVSLCGFRGQKCQRKVYVQL